MSAMMYAGDSEVVQLLLAHGLSIEERNKDQQSGLNLAAKNGQTKAVAGFLDNGAEINSVDKNHNTPLINAVIGQGYDRFGNCLHEDTVALLLEKGADADLKNNSDRTALAESLIRDNKKIQDLLIASTTIDIFDAGRLGRLQLVADRAKAGELDLRDEHGTTILNLAVQEQHFHIVQILVDQGHSINTKNKHGWSSLRMACFKPTRTTLKMIRFLVESGADINATDNSGETVLFSLSGDEKQNKISQYLIDAGIDLDKPDNHGVTSLMAACRAGNQRLVSILLEKGANKEIRNKAGQSIQDVLKEAIEMAEGAYNRSLTSKLKKIAKRLTSKKFIFIPFFEVCAS